MQSSDKLNKKIMIPFALVNNKVKGIDDITRLDTPTCLECGEILILKNGEKNRKHLAHKSDSKCIYRENLNKNCNNHNQETYEHKFAKEYLKDNLTYFREYGHSIIVKDGEFKLAGCRDVKAENIEIEYRGLKKDLNLSRDYIPDILIKTKDKLIALEIYMSNKKDPIVLKDILKNKNISVYEVDIRKIPELNTRNIFKNMKLIYSDLKIEFDNTIKSIQNIIIEKESLIKTLNFERCLFETDKGFLKSQLQEYRERYLNESSKNIKLRNKLTSDYEDLISTNKFLEHKYNKLEDDYKRKDKEEYLPMRKFIMKYLYSNEMNEIIKNDMKRYSPKTDEFHILDKFLKSFNGKVGAFISQGGKEKSDKIKAIIKAYKENIVYLGINNNRFQEMVGLKTDKGEEILRTIVDNNILDIVE